MDGKGIWQWSVGMAGVTSRDSDTSAAGVCQALAARDAVPGGYCRRDTECGHRRWDGEPSHWRCLPLLLYGGQDRRSPIERRREPMIAQVTETTIPSLVEISEPLRPVSDLLVDVFNLDTVARLSVLSRRSPNHCFRS